MGKKLTTEDFMCKAKKVHGDKYDYSLVNYVTAFVPITIICKTHGMFTQTPAGHLVGKGCAACSGNLKLTTDTLIQKSKLRHGDRYDYSLVDYVDIRTMVKIICKEHGVFTQTPDKHLQGSGCPTCAGNCKLSLNEFIYKATCRYTGKYDYSLVDYVNAKQKVSIVCKEHGVFTQTPGHHLYGKGCPKCAQSRTGWTYTKWESAGESSKYFQGFKLYIIECTHPITKEHFIKVGKTFVGVSRRFMSYNMPYEWKLIKEVEGSARYISELEEEIHRNLKAAGYIHKPILEFKGMHECYSAKYLERITDG